MTTRKTTTSKATTPGARVAGALRGERRFIARVFTLAGGTIIGQVIAFAATPVLSRLFGPTDFGILGLVNAVAAIVIGISALRFDMAIVLPKHPREGARVLALSVYSVLGTTLAMSLALLLLRDRIAGWMGHPELGEWLWWAPPIVLATGLYNTFAYWLTREKRFGLMAVAAALASAASAGTKIGAGYAGLGTSGLVGGQFAGQILAACAIAIPACVLSGPLFLRAARPAGLSKVAAEFSEFPKYHAPMTLVSSLTQTFPIYLLGFLFGPAEIGHWTMAFLLLSAPVAFVANATRQVLLQRASETRNSGGNLSGLLRGSTLMLFLICTPPAIAGAFVIPSLLRWLLGEGWDTAGHLATLMLPWQVGILVGIPASSFFPVLRMQRTALVWQVFSILVSGLAFVGSASMTGTVEGAALGYSVAMAFLSLGFIGLVARRCARDPFVGEKPVPDT